MKKIRFAGIIILVVASCNQEPKLSRDLKGVGPITQLELAPISDSLMNLGQDLFKAKCSECHTMEFKNSGPDISDILAYRHNEWVVNFMLNKEEMLQKDSLTLITRNQYEIDCGSDIKTKEEALQLLEYLRQYQIWLHEFNVR